MAENFKLIKREVVKVYKPKKETKIILTFVPLKTLNVWLDIKVSN